MKSNVWKNNMYVYVCIGMCGRQWRILKSNIEKPIIVIMIKGNENNVLLIMCNVYYY
jgi:hypothetical protein